MRRPWSLLLLFVAYSDSFSAVGRCWNSVRSSSTAFGAHSDGKESASSILVPPFVPTTDEEDEYPSLLHFIHIFPLLSDDEASLASRIAHDYAEKTGRWNQPDFERHATYATCDFAVEDSQELTDYLEKIGFDDRIFGLLSDKYGVDRADMEYLDLFCAHYRGKTPEQQDVMDRLEAHRDGSLLSFTVTLTPPEAFSGGGTFFDALRDAPTTHDALRAGGVVRPCSVGNVVLHSGKLLHGADVVTSGERTVLVGFVDVDHWKQRPGALSDACRDWGRMDVATKRYQRQMEKAKEGSQGWHLKTRRWVKQSLAYSSVFASARWRADPEFQRVHKLQTEDRFLRCILLSKEELRTGAFLGDGVAVL